MTDWVPVHVRMRMEQLCGAPAPEIDCSSLILVKLQSREETDEYIERKNHTLHTLQTVKFFSKLNQFIFGYFDPVNIYFYTKNK